MAGKFLVVDESAISRVATRETLTQLRPDCSVVEAADAIDGLLMACLSSPDIALLDYKMAGQDGLSLAADLRALLPNIQIAIVTAHLDLPLVERAAEIGASFVAKPLNDINLADLLDGLSKRPAAAGEPH